MPKEPKDARQRNKTTPQISRPATPTEASAGGDSSTSPPPTDGVLPLATSQDDFKMELIHSMSAIFKQELQLALTETLSSMKAELQVVKVELTSSIANVQSDVNTLKRTVDEVESTLSACTDDVVHLQNQVELMCTELIRLEDRCEILESFSRRNNLRIVGVSEDSSASSSTEAVAALLKTAFNLQKEPILDRWHRTLRSKPKQGEPPRPIVVRLHYHKDCVDILKQARGVFHESRL